MLVTLLMLLKILCMMLHSLKSMVSANSYGTRAPGQSRDPLASPSCRPCRPRARSSPESSNQGEEPNEPLIIPQVISKMRKSFAR